MVVLLVSKVRLLLYLLYEGLALESRPRYYHHRSEFHTLCRGRFNNRDLGSALRGRNEGFRRKRIAYNSPGLYLALLYTVFVYIGDTGGRDILNFNLVAQAGVEIVVCGSRRASLPLYV